MKCHGVRPPKCSIAGGAADNPYTWYICWKCAVTLSIRSPFAPLTLKPCFLQIARNSMLVHSCNLPLSIVLNTTSSTSYLKTNCEAG